MGVFRARGSFWLLVYSCTAAVVLGRGVGASPVVVQSSSAAADTVGLGSAVVAGNTLVLGVAWMRGASGHTTGVADTLGNTGWVQVGVESNPADGEYFVCEVWACVSARGGSCGATVSFASESGVTVSCCLAEVSGLASSLSVMGSGGRFGNSGSASSGSVAMSGAGLVVAMLGVASDTSTSVLSGWSRVGVENGGGRQVFEMDAVVVSGAESVSAAWSIGPDIWEVCVVGFAGAVPSRGYTGNGFFETYGCQVFVWWFFCEGAEFGVWFIRSRQRLY